ncbi:carbohydrate ABC transporter permease [Rhizobium mayense]|uniref:Sugar ABC transporter permease n=1 Tax=Rhizobium mayense TaxID=1312184 RepID=A0ABT7K4I9_9HYPH|nr:sugar ABC transporter permease [Rhizobium mayense]MDL2403528.1 sugar ABC transporter permease [Rhizobium mayense]
MPDRLWRFLTIGPAVILFLGLTVLPMINLAVLSFHDIDWAQGLSSWTFTGVKHYVELRSDALFGDSIRNTLIFAMMAVTIQMVIGFALAVLTSSVVHGRLFYRTVFLLPILVPGIIIGAIWKLMFSFDFGILNTIVAAIGMTPQDWLGDANYALASIIVVDIWHWTPFCFLLLLASLETLPQDVYEAAAIDGASNWQSLRLITIPLMLPAIAVTFVFRLILAFKVFDEVFLLTGGGPGSSTEVVSFTIYRRFFTEDQPGYGSAMSIATFAFIALLIIVVTAATQRKGARP